MDKIFAIENGCAYVEVDGAWHRCSVLPDRVEVMEEAAVTPGARYNLMEARAKCASLPAPEPMEDEAEDDAPPDPPANEKKGKH